MKYKNLTYLSIIFLFIHKIFEGELFVGILKTFLQIFSENCFCWRDITKIVVWFWAPWA